MGAHTRTVGHLKSFMRMCLCVRIPYDCCTCEHLFPIGPCIVRHVFPSLSLPCLASWLASRLLLARCLAASVLTFRASSRLLLCLAC
jgi:hypothetical protein